MSISGYRKIQIEQAKLDRKLDEIASRRSQESYTKGQLLRGSRSRITLLSLAASSQIEKKYTELYGENWREKLSPKTVLQIEKEIKIEKRNALKEIEENTLRVKVRGTPYVKTLSKRR